MDRVIPFSTQRITCPYGQVYGRYHNGVDLGWRSDEEMNGVFANSKGTVIQVVTGIPPMPASSGSYGNYIKIDHHNGMYSLYAHLREVYVSVGQEVDSSTKIALMGESGATIDSEGIAERHLHFEVFNGGTKIDPTPYLVEPIYTEPAPQPTPEPTPSEEFNIGDRVVVSGVATEDSYGNGNQTAPYGGNPNDESDIRYITALNMEAPRPYHISVGNTLGDGDRGWVSKDQIRKI